MGRLFLTCLSLCAVLSAAWRKQEPIIPGSPASHHKPVEPHHSLAHPFDSSVVYWRYGGSTVMTNKQARLTPATQSRSGWLWNNYPLSAGDWEVEVMFKTFSDGHIGGDGWGFWVLDGSLDPNYQRESDYLNGPVFGVRTNFKGFGVVFDTYDNDGRRDNPSIFVLENFRGQHVNFNHDNDFADDMAKDTHSSTTHKNVAYKCTASIRNADSRSKVMIRYVKNILHVYVDYDLTGYKFCLAVDLTIPFDQVADENDKSHGGWHFALTAMTGQVADIHDIYSITTRYLDDMDMDVNDDDLVAQGAKRQSAGLRWFFWIFTVCAGLGLIALNVYEITTLKQLTKDQVNPVYLCQRVNELVLPHYMIHILLTACLLLFGSWLTFFLNLPLAGFRVYQIATGADQVSPSTLNAYTTRLYVGLVCYAVLQIVYIYTVATY